MNARRISVRDILVEGTLAQIQRVVDAFPEGAERDRYLEELADSLAALQAEKPGVAAAIRDSVERAVAEGTVTEDEGRIISTKLG